jgi:hypothetical protein
MTLEHYMRYYDDIYKMMIGTGTFLDPTLVADGGITWLFRREPERLSDKKLQILNGETQIRSGVRGEAELFNIVGDDQFRGRWVDMIDGIHQAHQSKVRLLAGTDAPVAAIFPGVSLHWELEFLAEAQIPPIDVLRFATEEAAEVVGADQDLGTLEAGKLADIVLLNSNPLEDIQNTQDIWRVLKGGLVFNPEDLLMSEKTGAN